MRNRQYFFRTETRGDEERSLLENPENPGFSWALYAEREQFYQRPCLAKSYLSDNNPAFGPHWALDPSRDLHGCPYTWFSRRVDVRFFHEGGVPRCCALDTISGRGRGRTWKRKATGYSCSAQGFRALRPPVTEMTSDCATGLVNRLGGRSSAPSVKKGSLG